jgi:hypothetical protein
VDPHGFHCGFVSFFYLNAYPDLESQTNADPDPGQTLPEQKIEVLPEKNT